MFVDGFRFGLLLQLAVGPICLMIFNTAGNSGFGVSLWAVLAVALVDGLYIALAGTGISLILQKSGIRRAAGLFGGLVLLLFGLDIVLGAFGIVFLPHIGMSGEPTTQNVFLRALFMTASNPLTIVFWGGLFSAKAVERRLNTGGLFFFGTGCIAATVVFLAGVAAAGTAFRTFLPPAVLSLLNVAVGVFLVFFGLGMIRPSKKEGVS